MSPLSKISRTQKKEKIESYWCRARMEEIPRWLFEHAVAPLLLSKAAKGDRGKRKSPFVVVLAARGVAGGELLYYLHPSGRRRD